MSWHPLLLSLQVTVLAALVILVVGLGLALWLARTRFAGKSLVETAINLPLVLPPSVVGYYLLLFLGRNGPLVSWFNLNILFTWPAAVVAAVVVALPLMVQTSRAAIETVDPALENAARTLGSTEWEVVFDVTLPLAQRGVLAGLILGFARALGEFGATLMVAGNIPGRTQTVPLAIYDAVQANRPAEATLMVLLMTAISFTSLWAVQHLQPRRPTAS